MAKKKKKTKKAKAQKKKVHVSKKVDKKVTGAKKHKAPKKVDKKVEKGEKVVEKKEAPKKEAKKEKKVSFVMSMKNRLASLLLIAVGLLAVVFVGAFFVKKVFEPVSLARVLPHENTVMMADFDFFSGLTNRDAFQSLGSEGGLDVSSFTGLLEEALAADFETEVKPWLGYKHGYALLKMQDEDEGTRYEHMLFIQSIDQEATLEFLSGFELESHQDNLVKENYNNYSLYSFKVGQNVHFMNFDKYFVFARSSEALKMVIDVHMGEVEALAKRDEFLKVRNNLKRDIGFVYYNPARLFDYYIRENPTSSSSLIRPVLALFDSQGHSIILEDDAVVVQTYMNFSTHGSSKESLSRLTDHYKGDLIEFMPGHFDYFWGSNNLAKFVGDLGTVLNQLHPSSFNILEGALNAKKESFFGYEVDLRDDIYKVFENEFALGLYAEPDYIHFLFTADGQDRDHIAKLEAYYLERMSKRGYLIIPGVVPEEGEENLPQISAYPYDAQANVFTAMLDDTFVMSTNRSLVVDTLKNMKSGTSNSMDSFKVHRYLKDFDEVNIMSPAFMGELLGGNFEKVFQNFTRIQSAKSIFLDGMAVVHVLEF